MERATEPRGKDVMPALRHTLGISDPILLAHEEERTSKQAALAIIHTRLFGHL